MDSPYSGTLEASSEDVEAWLLSSAFEAKLFSFFPCTDILPSSAETVLNPPQPLSLQSLQHLGIPNACAPVPLLAQSRQIRAFPTLNRHVR